MDDVEFCDYEDWKNFPLTNIENIFKGARSTQCTKLAMHSEEVQVTENQLHAMTDAQKKVYHRGTCRLFIQ